MVMFDIFPGGTDLEREYGDVRPWRPPFHASPVARKGPISSKRVSSQDPLLRKFGNYSLYGLNFQPTFSPQALKFGNFQPTSPQIWKFSAHKPPNLEIFRSQAPLFRGKCQFASPTLRKSGPHTTTWKKSWVPPRGYILAMFRRGMASKCWRQNMPFCLKLSSNAQKSVLSWSISISRILGPTDVFFSSCIFWYNVEFFFNVAFRTFKTYNNSTFFNNNSPFLKIYEWRVTVLSLHSYKIMSDTYT